MKKIMLGTSDAWSMSRSSIRPSEPAYYIEDCRIFALCGSAHDFDKGTLHPGRATVLIWKIRQGSVHSPII